MDKGVVVSVLDVYEDLYTHEMSWQAGPQLANQLNALIRQMASYDTETITFQPAASLLRNPAHFKFVCDKGAGFYSDHYAFSRTLQQVQSPGLKCYKKTTLLLDYNHNNVIGIVGSFNGSDTGTVWKNYYISDIDHVEHKKVDTKRIPLKEVTKGIVVDAMEPLCTNQTAS